jgi:hypothetical protein
MAVPVNYHVLVLPIEFVVLTYRTAEFVFSTLTGLAQIDAIILLRFVESSDVQLREKLKEEPEVRQLIDMTQMTYTLHSSATSQQGSVLCLLQQPLLRVSSSRADGSRGVIVSNRGHARIMHIPCILSLTL